MYNSKLIQTFLVLNSQEKELLKKWISSPIGTTNQDIQNLFNYLLSKRKISPKLVDKKRIFLELYPAQAYNDLKLRHLSNRSLQSLERFVHFLVQKKDSYEQKKSLIQFYTTKKLHKYAKYYLEKSQKAQSQQVQKDGIYYYNQYQLEQQTFELQGTDNRMRQTNLQEIFEEHSISFIINTLRYSCTAVTHQNIYKSAYDIPFLGEILSKIEEAPYKDIVAIQLYYNSYKALVEPEQEKYFERLKKLLLTHPTVLSSSEIKSLYVMAINYCVRRLNTGSEHYVQAVFELYQYGLVSNILIEEGILSRFTYKNIIAIAIRLKKYEWTTEFIHKYTSYLAIAFRQNYETYAKAKLLFSQGLLDQTLQLLAQVEFDDIFLNMDSKLMLLKIYYEQHYTDSLEALLVSFRRFLQRKSIMVYQKQVYENTISLTEKLLKLAPKDKIAKQRLLEEIEQTNPLTERPWLLAQLNKLK